MTEDDRVNDTEEETDRDDVEDDGFGYSVEGTWDEIVEFGESIVSAFESSGIERETISEWDSWRPRSGEETTEMREKTVEKAKVDEGEDTSEMVDETAEHLSKTGKKTAEGDIEEAAENASESAKSAGKAVGGAGRDVVRTLEDKVYRRITKTNPLYFDTEEFNASLEPLSSMTERLKRTIGDGGDDEDEMEYKMTIKPESDDVEEALGNEFDDESER